MSEKKTIINLSEKIYVARISISFLADFCISEQSNFLGVVCLKTKLLQADSHLLNDFLPA
jgi:hypothetical protein